jgi:hypothetical protein
MSEELAVVKAEPRHMIVPKAQTFAPTNLTEAIAFADMIAKSDLAPRDFKGKPGNVLIAMQMGAEVGLSPLQALQNIAVINGRPCLWGDAALGVVQSHPSYESHKEFFEGSGDGRVAVFQIKRKGQEWHETRFSVSDAKKARLWGKEGPWQTYPDRMLQQRARGFGMRDKFSDALRGLITAEEAADIPPTVDDNVRESLRQSRREVERATLEVSKEPNRGHDRAFIDAEVAQNSPKEGVLLQSVDDRVAQASTPEFNEREAERARPKSDKPSPELTPLETAVLDVDVTGMTRLSPKQIEENKSLPEEKKHVGAQFFRVKCIGDITLYLYDQHLFRAVLMSKGKKKAGFMVQRGAKGLLSIKEIVHIDGNKFARDPITKEAIPADLLASTEKVINAQPAASNTQETPSQTMVPASTQTAFPLGANMRSISAEIASYNDKDSVDGAPLKTKSGKPFCTVKVKHLESDPKHDPHSTFQCFKEALFASLKAGVGKKLSWDYSVSTDANGRVWQSIESIAVEDESQEGVF